MLWAIARAFSNLLRLPLLPLALLGRIFGRPRGDYVHVRLGHRLTELPGRRPFFLRFIPDAARALPTPISSIRRLAEHVANDPRVKGVVFEIPPLATGWASCASVRRIMVKLRERGLAVVAYLPHGGGNRELFLASGASRILLGPHATVAPLGLAIQSRYIKPLLDKLGVTVHSHARGDYKTAVEPFVRDSMSDAQREQLTAVLATIDAELVRALAELPDLDQERARALFERGLLHGTEAVDAGLAAAVAYDDDLPTKVTPDGTRASLVRAGRYLAFREKRFFARVFPRPYVAVVEVKGPIASAVGSGARRMADPEHLAAALRSVRRDRFAIGAVLYIDSPGGSALASDQIHREVVRLKEKKPVVACFGDVAASGGYYVAAPADTIIAEPTTITGSIGVIAARFVAEPLLAKIGVRTETLRTAPHADMMTMTRELTPEETAILDRELDAFYRGFVGVVAEGRGRPYDEVEALARGRVWAGRDACDRGLVDRLGGLAEAVEEVRTLARLPARIAALAEPRAVHPRRLDVPPAPPVEAAAELAAKLAPDALFLLALAAGQERVLYFAPGLPELR